MSLAALLLAIAATSETGAAQTPYYPAGECSNIDPTTQRRCVDARMGRKEREMESLLAQARRDVAGRQAGRQRWQLDMRGDPAYLDRSQAAWRSFVESNCTIVAAYPGGSNSSVSDRIAGCREGEIDNRIRFLRHLLEETGPFGL